LTFTYGLNNFKNIILIKSILKLCSCSYTSTADISPLHDIFVKDSLESIFTAYKYFVRAIIDWIV